MVRASMELGPNLNQTATPALMRDGSLRLKEMLYRAQPGIFTSALTHSFLDYQRSKNHAAALHVAAGYSCCGERLTSFSTSAVLPVIAGRAGLTAFSFSVSFLYSVSAWATTWSML